MSSTSVPAEADLIQLPDLRTDKWSENLLIWAHDASGVAVYSHFSRMTPDPRVWEAVIAVWLPNQDLWVSRTFGIGVDQCVAGPASASCLVPNRTWRLAFDGVAQRVPSLTLSEGTPREEPREPVSIELIFDGVHEPWDMGHEAQEQDWCTFHLEQGGTCRGFVRVNGDRVPIDCMAFRDHSVGPRDTTGLFEDHWACCAFANHDVFSSLYVASRAISRPVNRAYRCVGGIFQEGVAVPETMVDLDTTTAQPRQVTLEARIGAEVERVSIAALQPAIFTLCRPIGLALGYDGRDSESCIDVICPATFVWNGQTGYGWLDRVRRVNDFAATRRPNLESLGSAQ